MRLNQVIALVKGRKARALKVLTEAHRGWNANQLNGMTKTYKPLDEEGEKLPSEQKVVSLRVSKVMDNVLTHLKSFYDIVLIQESANQAAKSSVMIDGLCLLEDVPVTGLLFLEKQMADFLTFVKEIPVLPIDKEWKWDENRACFATDVEITTRKQKYPEVVEKYPATKEHPAQVELYSVDRVVGNWHTVHLSGAIESTKKEKLIQHIEELQDSIKKAREEANCRVCDESEINRYGSKIFDYIFSGVDS